METLEPILAEHPFFEGITPEYLHVLVGCASNVRYATGLHIFREGDEANEFYLLRRGKVSLEVFLPGRGPITIQTVGAGEILGWSWLVPPYRWRFDARVVDEVRAIALDGKCLRTKCEDDPAIGFELLKRFATVMTDRLQATRLQLLDVYGRSS